MKQYHLLLAATGLSDLYLLEIPVLAEAAPAKPLPRNHVFILDRSGSMAALLQGLVDDVVKHLTNLPTGDTVSIGWFSGVGQCDFIVKGFTLSGPESIKKLTQILEQYKSVVGMTCFSQILQKTEASIADLAILNGPVSLVFFSDGNPVVPDFAAELKAVTAALHNLGKKVATAMIVGYGNYYNRDILSGMAADVGGHFIHANNLLDYSTAVTDFMEESADTLGVVQVPLPAVQAMSVFTIRNKTVSNLALADDLASARYVLPKTGRKVVYAISKTPFPAVPIMPSLAEPRVLYATALMLNQRAASGLAIEVLGLTGDVFLIDALTNAFTNEEHGAFETKLRKAVASPAGRLLNGHKPGYLPPADAPCLVDALELLMEDPEARFYPLHPDFKYDRISVKRVVSDTAPAFSFTENPAVEISTLTWNDSRLNLSITCMLPVTVTLDADHAKFGFAKEYPSFVFRSYSLVKDGNANVSHAFFSMGIQTLAKLLAMGMLDNVQSGGGTLVHKLKLKAVPVMNRKMAGDNISAVESAKDAVAELQLEAKAKLLRAASAKLAAAGQVEVVKGAVLTAEQIAYLAKNRIGKNGFQPEYTEAESTDSYEAKRFRVTVAGASSLPSLADLAEKKAKIAAFKPGDNGKQPKLTVSEAIMEAAATELNAAKLLDGATPKAVNRGLESTLEQLRPLRRRVQRMKFAIVLGKQWFPEFKSYDPDACKISANGHEVKFILDKVQVPV